MAETLTLPGFIDVHTHLREPSSINTSETIANGTRTALLGGFIMTCDMPNTPGHETWTEERLDEKRTIIRKDASTIVELYSGSQPESDNIGELAAMSKKSVGLKLYLAKTTGNNNDYEPRDFTDAVEEWHRAAPKKPILIHAGKDNLEETIGHIARDIGHPLHVCHVNKPEEVDLVTSAVQGGLTVTCGVCPHHLIKTSHDATTEAAFAHMKPPLANQVDVEKLWFQLSKGDINIIETDYAPHSKKAKLVASQKNPDGDDSYETTCFGVPGIEHVAPILLFQMKRERISLDRLVDAMHTQPQDILGVRLRANFEIEWDMKEYRIEDEKKDVLSGAKWTPYLGKMALGKPKRISINHGIPVPIKHASFDDERVISHKGKLL